MEAVQKKRIITVSSFNWFMIRSSRISEYVPHFQLQSLLRSNWHLFKNLTPPNKIYSNLENKSRRRNKKGK